MKPPTDEDRIHDSEAAVLEQMEKMRARDEQRQSSSDHEQDIPDRRDEAFAAMLKNQERRSRSRTKS